VTVSTFDTPSGSSPGAEARRGVAVSRSAFRSAVSEAVVDAGGDRTELGGCEVRDGILR
jgi:hypothetical protein